MTGLSKSDVDRQADRQTDGQLTAVTLTGMHAEGPFLNWDSWHL